MQLNPAEAGGGTANGISLVGNTPAGCPAFSSFRDITISGTATSYFATSVAISVWGNINFINVNEQITGASVVWNRSKDFLFTGAENEVAGGAGTIGPVVNVFNPVFPFVLVNSDYLGPSSSATVALANLSQGATIDPSAAIKTLTVKLPPNSGHSQSSISGLPMRSRLP
jgi:hypothetical protein